MKRIAHITELLKLKPKEQFAVISNGNVEHYHFVAKHPLIKDGVVAIWNTSYSTAKVFTKNSLSKKSVIMIGEYNPKQIGNVMIEQLQSEADSVKRIYCDKD